MSSMSLARTTVLRAPLDGALVGAKSSRVEEPLLAVGQYQVRLATSERDRMAAYALRFEVFNVEMQKGLDESHATGMDFDQYDAVCDHLIVEHVPEEDGETRRVVGTYRLQTGESAQQNLGYYSQQEFDFSPYERIRSRVVELGRACIDREHRTTEVLHLLWRGIVRYAIYRGARYLIGCSSLSSQAAAEGMAVYRALEKYTVALELQTKPTEAYALPETEVTAEQVEAVHVPKLLRTYLTVGAKICGVPAIDRAFKTIDFLTMMDLEELHPRMAARLFEGL